MRDIYRERHWLPEVKREPPKARMCRTPYWICPQCRGINETTEDLKAGDWDQCNHCGERFEIAN